jgi:chromosome partitioning protein
VLIIALLAMKGGVGKTTCALGLASAARARGKRVLFVDLDPQRNSTDSLVDAEFRKACLKARKRRDEPEALLDLLETDDPTREEVLEIIRSGVGKWKGVDVLPATRFLHTIERAGPDMVTKLREILALVADLYDVIVIDTRPAFGMLTTMAVYAANVALVVAEPKKYGLSGLVDTWDQLTRLKEAGLPDLRRAAVIGNQYDARQIEDRERMEQITKRFKPVMWEEILADRTVVSLANNADTPIHDYQDPRVPESTKTLDAWLDRAEAA